MASNFEGLAHAQIVCKTALFFVLHCVDDLEIVLVEWFSALLVVLRDTRVVPLLFIDCTFMFFPTCFARPMCLSYVYGFVGASAGVFVNAFFFLLRCVGFIFTT